MMPKIKFLITALLALGLVASACNGDDENNGENNTQNQDAISDTTEEDTTEEDVTDEDATDEDAQDDVADDTSEDTGDDGGIDRLQVASLYYREVEQSCPTSSCVNGIRINAISAQIEKVENGSGLQRQMNNADTDAAIEDILTENTFDKMENGWDCGTVDSPDIRYEFEARIWDGNDYVEKIQDITGCVQDGSTEPDAAEVQRIITYLEDLRAEYFDNQ
jgi:hypothetical protein